MPADFTIIEGDCRETLKTIPSETVSCCICSPPYHNLRRYGDGSRRDVEIGSEGTLDEHLDALVEVFREVRRVLHPSGTLWVNYGFAFANTSKASGGHGKSKDYGACDFGPDSRIEIPPGFKPKDCIPLPWMLTLRLIEDGWWFRAPIVWHKPSAMPGSQTDRPTLDYEHVLLFAKSQRYFYDAEAVKVKSSGCSASAANFARATKEAEVPGQSAKSHRLDREPTVADGRRALRSVWTIPAEPTKFNHFAAFPRKLVEPCVKSGTSERGVCPECFSPWRRVVEKSRTFESGSGRSGNLPEGKNGAAMQGGGETMDIRRGPVVHSTTVGWQPTCEHGHEPIPCTVLDVFCGTGRTGAMACALGRRFIGCELYPDYAAYARQYIANPDPMPVETQAAGQLDLFDSEGSE